MNLNINVDAFVSKLRNTVSQVAYQVNSSVNTIIPGNPVHRDYEILKRRCLFGCPGLVWHVHDAIRRDSASIKASLKDAIGTPTSMQNISTIYSSHSTSQTADTLATEKQLYTVFVFDKDQLDNLPNKAQRDAALEHVKRSVTQLTRLRHPSILIVHHPLEESRSSLAFVTEHVYGHLSAILNENNKNTDSDNSKPKKGTDLVDFSADLGPKDHDYQEDSCQLDDVQIKAGLLQICDGLRFLHNSAQLLLRNLCLDNIFVDSNNTWKIAGFDFCCQPLQQNASNSKSQSALVDLLSVSDKILQTSSVNFPSLKTIYLNGLPNCIIPNWSCSAPEHSNCDAVTESADIYSLGVISCALLGGKHVSDIDLSYEFGLMSDTYKRGIKVRELADSLPATTKSQLLKFAAINFDSRPSIAEFECLGIFQDAQVQAIRDLDSQFAWDRLKKVDFFNRLRDILPRLSHQVKVNRVAKSLLNEMVNIDMMPHVLPNLLIITRDSTPSEFKSKLFLHLKPAFRVLEPRSVPMMLLDNFDILFDRAKLCISGMQECAFTLVEYLLDMDTQIQEKCFIVLPNVKQFIDDKSMAKIVLPKLGQLCYKSSQQSIRVKCLDCIGKLVPAIEKWTVVESLLPIIIQMPSLSPEIIIAITNVIKLVMDEPRSELSKETVACKLLPFVVPLCIEKDLSLQQFQTVMALVRSLLSKVEKEQKDALAKRPVANAWQLPRSTPLILENYRSSNSQFR